MIGRSPAFVSTQRNLVRFARLPYPLLIQGETGTGKELAAHYVHTNSERSSEPYVAINCAAIPQTLTESHLFGHVRGAFTGAHKSARGAFEQAHRGTLFLDEVGELDLSVQAKLLRVLETGSIRPVGAESSMDVDVRLLAATHRDLEQMIADGLFREDLYYRLNVFVAQLPNLSERSGDTEALVRHFLAQVETQLGRPIEILPETIVAARKHHWQGNIRGLRNAVLRAAALSQGPLTPQDLIPPPPRISSPRHARGKIEVPRGSFTEMRRAILETVVAEQGSIRQAAQALDVPRSTLGGWLREPANL